MDFFGTSSRRVNLSGRSSSSQLSSREDTLEAARRQRQLRQEEKEREIAARKIQVSQRTASGKRMGDFGRKQGVQSR